VYELVNVVTDHVDARCKHEDDNSGSVEHSKCVNGCTVHVDNIKSFICPTNAHTDYLKSVKTIKSF